MASAAPDRAQLASMNAQNLHKKYDVLKVRRSALVSFVPVIFFSFSLLFFSFHF